MAHQVINAQQQSLYTAIPVALPAGRVVQVHRDQLREELQCEAAQSHLCAAVKFE